MKPAQILRELKKYPKKLLGQNFLVDGSVVEDMVAAADLKKEEAVIEIGPGLGILTFAILKKVARVIAIEIDYEFANYLRLKKARNLTVIRGDALTVDWETTINGQYKIVSNIPYSITSPLLRKIFALKNRPDTVVLLVQKEMAERIAAVAGKSSRGLLTLIVEANAKAEIIRKVKSGSFYPRPKADSAIIKLTINQQSLADQIFWPAVEAGFRHKRQMLINSLKDLNIPKTSSVLLLEKCGLSSKIRPQELSFEDWKRLSERIKKFKSFHYLEEKA